MFAPELAELVEEDVLSHLPRLQLDGSADGLVVAKRAWVVTLKGACVWAPARAWVAQERECVAWHVPAAWGACP